MAELWPDFVVINRGDRHAIWEGPLEPVKRSHKVRIAYRAPLAIEMVTIHTVQPRVQVLQPLLERHPAIVGSRRVPGGGTVGWPWYRNLISSAGSLYARTVLSSPVHDLTTGFKGFRRETLQRLDVESLRSDGFGFQIEVTACLLALGVDVHEMPILFADRKVGTSKMSTKIFVEAMLKIWQVRARARSLARN